MAELITLDMNTLSIQYLCRKDRRLAKIISLVGPITYVPREAAPYAFLIHEIIEQMLSIKAGAKIYGRLEDLCNGTVTPDAVNALSDEQIKSIGTANSKVTYIRNITDAVLSGKLDFEELALLPDDAVYEKLLGLKGIGKWTAKMYLIFVLDRQDILPYEDVAFLQAYEWMYKTKDRSKEAVRKKCKKWSPYSSIAARYLYKALDSGLTKHEFRLYKQMEL